MKVLLAGGGTGGHINPALAIASIIKQHDPSAEFLFVGTPNGMEARLVPAAGYALETMHVAGFQRKLNWKNIKRNCRAAYYLATSQHRAKQIDPRGFCREYNPANRKAAGDAAGNFLWRRRRGCI